MQTETPEDKILSKIAGPLIKISSLFKCFIDNTSNSSSNLP